MIRLTTLAAELAAHPSEFHASWQKLRDANQAAQFGWPDPDPTPDGSPPEPETTDQFRERSAAFGTAGVFMIPSGKPIGSSRRLATRSWVIRRSP